MGNGKWLWHLCLANMKKRGIRTFLTILGVVIGVISIVSMLSLGIGVKNQLMSDAVMEGSVTDITVYAMNNSSKQKSKQLTDKTIAKMEKIDHVDTVVEYLELSAEKSYGNNYVFASIYGVPSEELSKLSAKYGEIPDENGTKPKLLMGQNAVELIYSKSNFDSYAKEHKDDFKDAEDRDEWLNFTGETIETSIYDMGEDYAGRSFKFQIAGVTEESSYDMYCDIEVLKRFLKRNSDNGIIAGQPTANDGTALNYWVYSKVVVKVDDIENVDKVVEKLQDMGFQAESNKEYVVYMQKIVKIMQLLLGGIGMIALVVAVIGIGNTMTTAVYERIAEIGVLKVLGCDPKELRTLFLMESGVLGGIGGIIGVGISFLITEIVINKVAVTLLNLTKGVRIAEIPVSLAVGAVIFAVVLGILAGYFPAKWASRLKPVDAVNSL